jgi:2,4-dienoyl-CoA reductase (NADPH2)
MFKTGNGSGYTGEGGYVSERHKAYYDALARGGVGLIVVEAPAISDPGNILLIPHLHEDKFIPGFKTITDIIHKYKCPAFVQMLAGGGPPPPPNHKVDVRRHPAMSSKPPSESEMDQQFVRRATIAEIQESIDKFARAGERAQKAGFDGIEVNGGTNHLINSFLSRAWNNRQDAYGCGSLENRARFPAEIIQGIKKRLGKDFPVTIIINIAEFGIDRGTTVDEGQRLAQILEKAGADAIQARAYGFRDYFGMIFPEHIFFPEGPKILPKELDWSRRGAGILAPLAAATKKVVSVPVSVAGRFDPELAEQVIEQGKADLIGMTRRLLADPELPNKVAAGRLDDIAPCTACLECTSARLRGEPVRCRVNAALGGEQEYLVKKADRKKKVVVVGGGPGGMEAARVAAIRGHEVTLYEKESKLGGLLHVASLVKGLEIEDIRALMRYFKTQITKLGVNIKLGEEFNTSTIQETKPDVVILAVGGTLAMPEIPGINRRNVVSGPQLHHTLKIFLKFLNPQVLRWLTNFWMPLGKRVVIIGGQLQGCELAEFLIKRGRKVTIVDTADALGDGLALEFKTKFFEWLEKNGATTIAGVKYEEITDKGLIITKEGKRQTIEADTIVTAVPSKPNNELITSLKGKVPEVYAIGDCNEPRLIINAVADGYHVAHDI